MSWDECWCDGERWVVSREATVFMSGREIVELHTHGMVLIGDRSHAETAVSLFAADLAAVRRIDIERRMQIVVIADSRDNDDLLMRAALALLR